MESQRMKTQDPPIDKRQLMTTGIAALNRGDALGARRSFEAIAQAGLADASAWLGLAYACRMLADAAAAGGAVDRALDLEPRNLRALIFKGDHLAALGDGRAACAFYVAASNAAPAFEPLPADLKAEVARAEAMRDRYTVEFESFLRARIGNEATASERFAESLEILSGRKKIFLQQPRYYYFPAPASDVLTIHPTLEDLYVNAPEGSTSGLARSYVREAGRATMRVDGRDARGAPVVFAEERGTTGRITPFSPASDVSNRFWFETMFRRWADDLAVALAGTR